MYKLGIIIPIIGMDIPKGVKQGLIAPIIGLRALKGLKGGRNGFVKGKGFFNSASGAFYFLAKESPSEELI